MVDGPAGTEVGPNAFLFEDGRLRLFAEGGPSFAYATAINDHGQVAGVMEESEANEDIRPVIIYPSPLRRRIAPPTVRGDPAPRIA